MTDSRQFVILTRLLALTVVLLLLYINNSKSKKIIKNLDNLTFDDFPLFFKNFIANKLQSNFIGLTSNNIDCLNFVIRNNYVNIEFEVLYKEQEVFAKKLIDFAKKKECKIVRLSYKNKMKDNLYKNAIVYQLKTKLNKEEVTPYVVEVYKTVFNCTKNTLFHLVF